MTTPNTLADDFARLFGAKLTAEQLWLLTKFAKYVRLRARNNAAYNNFASRVFPYATFRQVNKERADGSTYPGLSIKVDEVETSGDEE